ncbi:NmrA family transcriptional regulator, partial [Mesorhizobium sp. M1C.F.Ca.ET.176.01.1.1]
RIDVEANVSERRTGPTTLAQALAVLVRGGADGANRANGASGQPGAHQ